VISIQTPIFTLLVAGLLTGCASSSPKDSFSQVQSIANERLNKRIQWNTRSSDDQAAQRAVDDLLAHPLTADIAVQIALLNNHRLQAIFEDLGIAQADFVQAGLLQNPVFNLSIRFPNQAPGKTYLDIAAAENFLNIFLIPARKKIAATQLRQTTARVSDEVLSLAAQAQSAFYDYQAAEQIVELRRSISDAAGASYDAATRLRQAGNITELAYLSERSQAARATIDLTSAKADADDAREKLNALLGVWGSETDWTADKHLPELPGDEINPQGLESLAINQRQDLAAAKQQLQANSQLYGFTVDTRFFAEASAGVEGERETDGQWRVGPTLSVPVPLFDNGQAAIPRAAAVVRQSQQRYIELAVEIRAQVRAARARMLNARQQAQFYHDEILPTQQKLLDQTQLHFNGMLVDVFGLLRAKRDEIDAAANYVQALHMYWTSRAELQRAVGGRLPPGQMVMPTSQPATSQPAADEHQHHHGDM